MRRLGLSLATLVWLLLLTPQALAAGPDRSDPVIVDSAGTTFVVDAPRGMGRFAEEAAGVVEASWPAILSAAGAVGVGSIEVAVEREIDAWFERRGEPPRNPEWAAGLAMYDVSAIVIRSANPEWKSTLRHELAHMAVDMATGGRRLPRWFNEGFAIATAEQWSVERAATMIRAGLSGNFYDFAELTTSFPAAASSADLAYAQSFHFVRYIQQSHGLSVFPETMSAMRSGQDWDTAFADASGTDVAALERAWADHVTTRYKWTPALTGGGGAWGFMAALTVVVWRRRSARDAARIAELQRHEATLYAADPDDEVFG